MDKLVLEIYRKKRPNAAFLKAFFNVLTQAFGGKLIPERVGTQEPERTKFDASRLDTFAEWLQEPGDMLFLSRKAVPLLKAYIDYDAFRNAIHRTAIAMWLDPALVKAQDTLALCNFLIELCERVHADYGFLTPKADRDRQNYLVRGTEARKTSKYVGVRLEQGLPGLYWINWFGSDYEKVLNRPQACTVPSTIVKSDSHGVLVAYEGLPTGSKFTSWQVTMRRSLGEDAFFDIRQLDRKMRTPWSK